jgi:hypothetical protein
MRYYCLFKYLFQTSLNCFEILLYHNYVILNIKFKMMVIILVTLFHILHATIGTPEVDIW